MKRVIAALIAGLACSIAIAQKMPADVAGGKDHPTLSRYAGSWLVAQDQKDFDAVTVPAGAKEADAVKLEGRITRLFYLAPAGKSVLEVQRNYELALEKAGAVRRDGCAAEACGDRAFGAVRDDYGSKKMADGDVETWSAWSLVTQWQLRGTERYWYGTLNASGTTLHVSVLSAKQGLVAIADKYVATVVQIVQPKAMETGKVTVDANAMARGLQAEGKMALYGLYFDTGKSDIKPESKAQLDEMAMLLQTNAALRVYIVGHTDNQGTLDANLALSRARAQAVADALVRTYKVDPKRLAAAGVANYAPLASNSNDAGRAKNRRVELVVQ